MNSPVIDALRFARAEELAAAMDAPRSWSKEAKLAFLCLPPQLQEYYVVREKERDREVRRCQTEAAEARKALAETQKQLEEARKAAIQQPEATDGIHQNVAA